MKYDSVLYPFESKRIEIENENLHYVDEGAGQVILFSHAAIGSSFMYRRIIQILSRDYRCIALDYPGFGLSQDTAGKKYSIISQSSILERFIHSLNITDIIGLGHDTGGPSLFQVAGKYPELFKGFILTDTIIFPTAEYKKIDTMLSIVDSWPFKALNAWTNFLTRITINKGIVTRDLRVEEKRGYYQITKSYSRRSRVIQVLSSLRSYPDSMIDVKQAFENQLADKPSLLIYGENDPVRKLGIADRIHTMLPNSDLYLIEKEGHFPHEGQPERISEIIDKWLINF